MFGMKNFGAWEGVEENGAVNKILKSWFPLLIRRGAETIVETATGNEVGKIYCYTTTPVTHEAIKRQLAMLHPAKKYVSATLSIDKDGISVVDSKTE